MMIKRIIATFLAVLMTLAAFTVVVSAEETETEEFVPEFNTASNKPALDNYLTGEYSYVDEDGKEVKDVVDTPEERLELMDLRVQNGDYRLYVDAYSGEVAVEQISTGETLFTNPYNLAGKDVTAEMLSQIKVTLKDTSSSDKLVPNFDTFTQAVMGGDLESTSFTPSQINVRYIQNGIRVEYALGRADSRYLVPEVIDKEVFETQIKNVAIANGCSEIEKMWLDSFFSLKDLDSKNAQNETIRESWLKKYPMLQKTVDGQVVNRPIYVINDQIKPNQLRALEKVIKKYCPEFTYEALDNHYAELNYVSETPQTAYFKIALEYTLNDNGVSVRLPASGIRFDESVFRLEEIEILPYMGAGASANEGYVFFPDGSGALFPFNNGGTNYSFAGKFYGEDFGYYNISSASPHNEVLRYPVFGASETVVDAESGEANRKGFVAIVEEGESMMSLMVQRDKNYATIKMRTNPRPYDTVVPTGATEAWYVVSERKYTDDYKIRYIMLSDKSDYSADYVGMAKAYRDYLVGNGTLTKLTDEDVDENLPIYIETFGAIETTKKFLSIPYKTNVALTSFEDVSTMYRELSDKGVENINFILTGYGKGGLTKDTIPYKLKWDGAVQKGFKFEELLDDANENSYGVYPDFDFVFAGRNTLTDGLTLDDHVIKTIDGRYTSKREYSATRQTFVNYFELAISPAYFSRFYEKITDQYVKLNPQGISVSTLGDYLSSDFDEDEPYNREDNKKFSVEAFEYLSEKYSKVITSGGNAYTWKYVDVITDIATDSSRHSASLATVPFLGIVLHGYVETVSSPINMEGNIDYAVLRAIENGTAFKFILSYDNTELLKEYEDTSDYYSIRYDIWLTDLAQRYEEINRVLKDVQTSTIETHEFISGVRIADNNEIELDADAALAAAIAKEKTDAATAREELRVKLQKSRADIVKYNELINGEDYGYSDAKAAFDKANADYAEAKALAAAEGATDEQKAASEAALAKVKVAYAELLEIAEKYLEELKGADVRYASLVSEFTLLETSGVYTEAFVADLKNMLANFGAELANIKTALEHYTAEMNAYAADITANAPEILPEAESEEESKENTSATVTDSEYNKYATADATIVYEKYSNGTAFILNFNNYAVKVTIAGISYTIAAYGYITLR